MQELSQATIIKQNRRLNRISRVFGANLFLASLGILVVLFFYREQFRGIDFLALGDFFEGFDWLKLGILTVALIAVIADIALSAFFVRVYPKRQRAKIEMLIKNQGLNADGEIIGLDIFEKSFYETNYIARLRLDDGKEGFCFYAVDKTEPLPMGERWSLFYDAHSGFCVFHKRLPKNSVA